MVPAISEAPAISIVRAISEVPAISEVLAIFEVPALSVVLSVLSEVQRAISVISFYTNKLVHLHAK